MQAHFTASGRQLQTGVRPTDAYGSTVYDAQPDSYWRLNETTGDVATDVTANAANGRYFGGAVQGVPGVPGMPGTAIRLDGVDDIVSAGNAGRQPDGLLRGAVVQHHDHPGRQADRLRPGAAGHVEQLRPARLHVRRRPAAASAPTTAT